MKLQPPHNTPYQRLKNSKFGTAVRENKVLTGVAGLGSAVVLAGGAAQSSAFAKVAEYGIAPALGVGLASLGALAAHDAVVNDIENRPVFGTAKLATGVAATLGGSEIVGRIYDIPVLDRAFSTPAEKLLGNGQAVLGAAVAGGGLLAGKFAVERFGKAVAEPEQRGRNMALGAASAATSAAAVLGGAELIGRNFEIPIMNRALTGTVEALSSGGVGSVLGGTLLAGGAVQLGREAVGNFRRGGNDFITLAEGAGAMTAGLGGLQLAGHGLGLRATEGLLTEHAPLVGAVTLSGAGVAALRSSGQSVSQKGLRPLNSLGLAAGAAMVPGGIAIGLSSLGFDQAARFLGQGAEALGGAGLGLASYALGKAALEKGRKGDVMTAAGLGLASASAASASLFAVGDGLHVPLLREASEQVVKHTVTPFVDHVMEPVGRFLFNNPVAGGAALALGVGGYLYARYRASKSE